MRALNGAMMAALALLLAATPAGSTGVDRRGFTGTVDFVQHVGRSLPAELEFRDERGDAVRLGAYFGTNPVGLVFAYFGCSNLCPMQIRNLARAAGQGIGRRRGAGADARREHRSVGLAGPGGPGQAQVSR